jgi:hypothetical protein
MNTLMAKAERSAGREAWKASVSGVVPRDMASFSPAGERIGGKIAAKRRRALFRAEQAQGESNEFRRRSAAASPIDGPRAGVNDVVKTAPSCFAIARRQLLDSLPSENRAAPGHRAKFRQTLLNRFIANPGVRSV